MLVSHVLRSQADSPAELLAVPVGPKWGAPHQRGSGPSACLCFRGVNSFDLKEELGETGPCYDLIV